MTRTRQAAICFLLSVAPAALAQAVPAARGPAFYSAFSLPDVSGTLHYSLSLSETINSSYNGNGTTNSLNESGTVAYLSSSAVDPFSLVYAGAFLRGFDGQPNQVVSNLALSQVISLQRWRFVVSDAINYLPETPSGGLSGIPGLGDGNVPPVTTGSDQDQGILTNYAKRVDNRVSGTASRQLTSSDSLSFTGSQGIIRYLDVAGGSSIDSNSYTLSSGLQHRIDARTNAGVQYSYFHSSYIGASFTSTSQSVTVNASKTLNRKTTISGSIGPQLTSSSSSAIIPTSTSYTATAALSYAGTFANYSINYSHGTNEGSGVTFGSESTTLGATATRQFEQALNVSGHLSYSASSSLTPGSFSSKAVIFGVQANRSIARHASVYVSYSANHQLVDGSSTPSLAFTGLSQTLGMGVTYSPAEIRIGH